MATLYTHQDKNVHKTWLLMSIFFVVVIAIAWAFSYILKNHSILYFGVAFSVGMNVWGYWYSDSLVIKMSGAKPARFQVLNGPLGPLLKFASLP